MTFIILSDIHRADMSFEREALPRHADWPKTWISYMQAFIFRKGKNREKKPVIESTVNFLQYNLWIS